MDNLSSKQAIVHEFYSNIYSSDTINDEAVDKVLDYILPDVVLDSDAFDSMSRDYSPIRRTCR
jgi:hypothetical protein